MEKKKRWVRNDERTQAMLSLIGCAASLEILSAQPDETIRAAEDYAGACHLWGSGNDIVIPPMPSFLKGSQVAIPASVQISPVTPHPPQEATEPCIVLSPPLTAVLVELEPPTPPLPDTAVVLELPEEMFEELVAAEVGTATIIELLHLLFISKEYALVRRAAA